jgi:hypothetical protein
MQNTLLYFEQKKSELETDLLHINVVIELLKKSQSYDFTKFTVVTKANQTKIPEAYNSKLKYPSQIVWALKNFGPQTINDMVDNLKFIYGVENKEKLFNGLTYAASILHKKGELNAERVGKANKYSLKEPGLSRL